MVDIYPFIFIICFICEIYIYSTVFIICRTIWVGLKNPTLWHAYNKGADQSAHPNSLISPFIIHLFENMIFKLASCKISTKTEDQKLIFKSNYRLMQVKNFAECSRMLQESILLLEHSAILSTLIKLPFVFKTFVLSIFKWPLKICFTVVLDATKPVFRVSNKVLFKQSCLQRLARKLKFCL